MSEPVYVLDCTMTMSWFFEDEFGAMSRKSRGLLAKGPVLAPAIWRSEVLNTLLMAQRRGRVTGNDVEQILELVIELPVHVQEPPTWAQTREVLHIAQRHHITSYDATYLELAARSGVGLATLDRALRRASAKLGLPPVP